MLFDSKSVALLTWAGLVAPPLLNTVSTTRASTIPSRRQTATGPSDCDLYSRSDTQCSVTYYSDANCQNGIHAQSFIMNANALEGCGECRKANEDPGFPKGTVYVKANADGFGDNNRLVYEFDNSCPVYGLNSPLATLGNSSRCIPLVGVTGDEGIACYPNGYNTGLRNISTAQGASSYDSAVLAPAVASAGQAAAPPHATGGEITGDPQPSVNSTGGPIVALASRDDQSCSGFRVESQQDSHMPVQRMSDIVVCYGSAAPCPVSLAQQHTVTVTAELSLDLGGAKVGGLDIGATFGGSYAESESTTLTEGVSVPPNQAGYLGGTSKSTLFRGTFTGCSNGDQPGQANVPKAGGHEQRLVITDA